jgi:hypothetical protein
MKDKDMKYGICCRYVSYHACDFNQKQNSNLLLIRDKNNFSSTL